MCFGTKSFANSDTKNPFDSMQVEEIGNAVDSHNDRLIDTNTVDLNFVDEQNPMKYISGGEEKSVTVIKGAEENKGIVDKVENPKPSENTDQNKPDVKKQEQNNSVAEPKTRSTDTTANKLSITDKDKQLLTAFVSVEGVNESKEGKVAIAYVILNRLQSANFPNSIEEILFSKNQFLSSTIKKVKVANPKEEDYEAVELALTGSDPTQGAEYYYSPAKVKSEWHESSLYYITTVGSHRYFSLEKPKGDSTIAESKEETSLVKGAEDSSSEKKVESIQSKDSSVKASSDKMDTNDNTLEGSNQEVNRNISTGNTNNSKKTYVPHTDEEFDMLAKIIWAEARGESYEGKVAVGAVILNRLHANKFGKDIHSIIHAPKQFEPVANGVFAKATPSEQEYMAAVEAFNGVDPTNGATYFYAPTGTTSRWHESLVFTKAIGTHRFFKE